LSFLNATLYGNFADIEGDGEKIKAQIKRRGFKVDWEPSYPYGPVYGQVMTIRLSDADK
jgi:hypothetical protein